MSVGIPYRWLVHFVVPGLRISEPISIDQMQLRPTALDAEGRPQAEGSFRIEYVNCVQQSTVEEDAGRRVEDFVDSASLVSTVGHPRVVSVRLENEGDLQEAGLPIPISFPITLNYEAMVPMVNRDRLQAAITARAALPMDGKQLQHRASRWMRRLYGDRDPFNSFVSLWVAFNVLYAPYYGNGEQEAIIQFVGERFDVGASRELLERRIASDSLTRLATSGVRLRNRPIADELKESLARHDVLRDACGVLILLVLTLYAARNALIHGDLLDENRVHRELVRVARDVLASIIHNALHRQLGLALA